MAEIKDIGPGFNEENIVTKSTSTSSTFSGRKILIVDDESTNLVVSKAKIEKLLPNISCDIVINGYKALDMVAANKYQLILMDIRMPVMDGIETTRRIRELIGNQTPIIAHTSSEKHQFYNQ
jgi:CheY-like chemotaxis protein